VYLDYLDFRKSLQAVPCVATTFAAEFVAVLLLVVSHRPLRGVFADDVLLYL
jgi:hypothetical protein